MSIVNDDEEGEDGDDDGCPAYSHHDKIPPWWECVRSLDDDLITMMIMIMMIYI